jgi:hypothetical protein
MHRLFHHDLCQAKLGAQLGVGQVGVFGNQRTFQAVEQSSLVRIAKLLLPVDPAQFSQRGSGLRRAWLARRQHDAPVRRGEHRFRGSRRRRWIT